MNKQQFLENHDVQAFVSWFSKRLCSNQLRHGWLDRRSRKQVSFDSVFDAYDKYSWSFKFANPTPLGSIIKGRLFLDSSAALSQIQTNLTTAIKNKKDDDVRIWSQTLMRWGGVYPGNGTWLHDNQANLAKILGDVASLLGPTADDTQLKGISRFNSGMTKIYSLLVDDFIIYDTRVAAALTWVIRLYCEDGGIIKIPDNLCFPVGKAKESPNQKNPKCRNPSKGELKFPPLNPGSDHAIWNRRASWLLQNVLEKAGAESCFNQLSSGRLRALEAALFMIGYDISESDKCNNPTVSQDSKPEINVESNTGVDTSYPLETRGGKRIGFRYEITDSGLTVHNDKNRDLLEVSFIQLACVIKMLDKIFGDKFFPLENDRIRASNGTLGNGLGAATMNCEIGDHTYASYIGPILEDLGFLDWNGKRKGIEWKLVDQPATAADLKERVLQNLDA